MSANRFIDLLEEQKLLDPEVTVELRRTVAQSKMRVTIESLAKLLVENGQLTRFQATHLISQLQESLSLEAKHDGSSSKSHSPGSPPKSVASDDLELLPDELDPSDNKVDSKNPLEAKLIIEDVVEAVELLDAELVADENDGKRSVKSKRSSPISSNYSESFAQDTTRENVTFVKPVKLAGPKGNQWDAFRIWGVGFVLCVLLVSLIWLIYWVSTGNSANSYKFAQEAYENRDYEVAIERFSSFAKQYPKEEKASAARAFVAIATIRQASDQLGNPIMAIDKAETILPSIIKETSMSDTGIQSDLASALVSVAEKMLKQADNAKTTEDRKKHIEKLDRHLILMRNPQYIPNANRVTNESRIKAIEEDRERILRDVQRAEDLVLAIEKMKEAIEKSDVESAYQARRNVTRKYPQLELDAQLLELLQKATTLQQQAVKASDTQPVSMDPPSNVPLGRSLLLSKRNGSNASVASDMILFIKAKSSIYGLRGTDGQVLWRKNVDLEGVSEPIRLSNEPGADCLITIPSQYRMARLSAQDGTTLWELDFGSRLLPPSVDGETIFVATENGRAFALDAATGQSKWSKQLPQSLVAGVGGGSSKTARYVLGDHSNIYVLSRNDGSCSEVFYLGHAPGTVSVPPIYALGHLIVFQNVSAGNCLIRLLKVNEQGGKLEVAQASISLLKGHVVVPPSLDGRRLVVMTDLGETIAFDVEPASNGDKLNKVANIVANESQPRIAWPLVAGNELWIASNRFARFQIQVSKQKLERLWVREDEDQFTRQPFKMENYIVHTRVVLGTQGVRVTATVAESGDPVWEVDLGVPIVAIQSKASGGFAVINSQAALYTVDASAFADGKPLPASENPGRNQRSMSFSNPTLLPSGRLALLNTNHGNNIALLDPNGTPGSSLQVNRLQINTGFPSAEPLAVGPALVIPLNNSQLAYLDPISGKSFGSPFQPTLTVGVNTQWLTPVLLSDKKTIIAATNQKTLHRLSSGKQLKELSQSSTSLPWVQRLAVIGDTVCGVARGDAQDSLEFYNGTDLTRLDATDVDGRVTWGPYALGEQFLAYSETSGLVAYDKSGKSLWKSSILQTAFIGPAIEQGEDILVNTAIGSMYRIDSKSGGIKAEIKLGEPLSGPPLIFGNSLLFPGSEGTLIVLPASKTLSSAEKVDSL